MPTNSANPAIKHVFVLMLENRSFDHMLGFLNNSISQYSNSYQGVTYPAIQPADYIMPYDPGHEFGDALEQLCGAGAVYKPGGKYPPIDNSGFVSDYATTKSAHEGGATSNFGEIMKCYTPLAQLPVMSALVNTFTLCDNWFSSLPGPTWPNRFFAHAASSGGLDHSPTTGEIVEWETWDGFSFPNKSIYHLLDKHKKKYRLYRGIRHPLSGCIPGVSALKGIQLWDTHEYENFKTDINGRYDHDYTFIEPNYGDIVNSSYSGGQSQHPMDDVRGGEALIKSTYEALRNSPIWENSLLLITYDEHGGFYDHVHPPAAPAPDDHASKKYNQHGFTFKQYGVRVPALVVSAYTSHTISNTLFDHSSIPATLETMFGMPPLTNRDKKANNITSLASLKAARTDTPATLPAVAYVSAAEEAAMRAQQHVADENASVDSGNLPAFLHIVVKAELEREPTKSLVAQTAIIERFKQIKTRADARVYIESVLPGLLNEEGVITT